MTIILASTSPRRIELLTNVRIPFFTRPPTTDETPKKGESPQKMVTRLARDKAGAVLDGAVRDFGKVLIIAADTTVVAPGGKQVLGKPETRTEAAQMLRRLAGKSHTVLTGYCLLQGGPKTSSKLKVRQKVRVVRTRVRMRKLSTEQIERYLDWGESMDKAGAYAAQGYGMSLIESIQGSYTNVVGLPLAELLGDIRALTQLSY